MEKEDAELTMWFLPGDCSVRTPVLAAVCSQLVGSSEPQPNV